MTAPPGKLSAADRDNPAFSHANEQKGRPMTSAKQTSLLANPTCVEGLIKRAASGDEGAAAALISDFSSVIARELRTQRRFYSLKLLVDAEDIVQSVWRCFFGALAQGDATFRDSREVAAYLTKITQNRIETQFRRQHADKRDVRRTINAVDLEFADQAATQPSHALSTLELLQSVLLQMTSAERRVAKRRAEGATWEELALEMGSTAEAIRKRHTRTAARIIGELEAEDGQF